MTFQKLMITCGVLFCLPFLQAYAQEVQEIPAVADNHSPSQVAELLFKAIRENDIEEASRYFLGDADIAKEQAEFLVKFSSELKTKVGDPGFAPGFEVRDNELALVGFVYRKGLNNVLEIDHFPFLLVNDDWKAFMPVPDFSDLQKQFDEQQQTRFQELRAGQYKVQYETLSSKLTAEWNEKQAQPLDVNSENLQGTWSGKGPDAIIGLRVAENETADLIYVKHGNAVQDFEGKWTLKENLISVTTKDGKKISLQINKLTEGGMELQITIPESTPHVVVLSKSEEKFFEIFLEIRRKK